MLILVVNYLVYLFEMIAVCAYTKRNLYIN